MMAYDMPDQCFNVGIAEQNQLGMAAGMAMCGKIPFVYTTGSFLAYRGYEFIRNDICYQNLNVKVVGMGSGLAWRTLGPSHHTTEDIAVLRPLPNLAILSPATPLEAAACTRAAYVHTGPVYLRIGMSGETEFFSEQYTVRPGGSLRLTTGDDVAILSTGSILSEVMEAEGLLRAQGIHVSVMNMYSLKPFDMKAVLEAARNHTVLVTVDEHSVIGGLGGAVAETLADAGVAVPFLRIGLHDTFSKGYGSLREVRHLNGLDGESLADQIGAYCRATER